MTLDAQKLTEKDLVEKIRMLRTRSEQDRPEYREYVDELLFRFLGQTAKDLAGTKVVVKKQPIQSFSLSELESEVQRRLAPKPDWKVILAQTLSGGGVFSSKQLIEACKTQGCEDEVTPKMLGTWAGYSCGFVSREGDKFQYIGNNAPAKPTVSFEVLRRPSLSGHDAEWRIRVLEEMTDGAVWSIDRMRQSLKGKGFSVSESALNSGLYRMKTSGTLRQVGKGQYRLS